MKRAIAIGVVALASFSGASEAEKVTVDHLAGAEAPLATRVDRYLEALVDRHELGGVVRIARGDAVLVEKSIGMANWELRTPMSPGARFRIASITKTFTGAAVAMLAERGRLSLRDPLAKFVPAFPKGDKIEIRHLLLHESGVGNPDSLPCSDVTLDDLVGELAEKPLLFPPGTSSRYSNGGYALLARVIERAGGRPWEEFLRDEIFRPLSLTSTSRDSAEAILPMRVSGYIPGPGPLGLVNAPCGSAQGAIGSGALVSTAADLHRWARAVRNETLFKRASLEHPYGWGVRTYWERRAIEQSGIVDGAASYVAAYLDEDLYVVVLSNVQSGILTEVGKGVAALALGLEPPAVKPWPPAIDATPRRRRAWLGRYREPTIGSFTLGERNGALYQRWEGARYGSYVAFSGETSAFNSQEGASMQLVREPGGKTAGIRVTWGDSAPSEFRKEE